MVKQMNSRPGCEIGINCCILFDRMRLIQTPSHFGDMLQWITILEKQSNMVVEEEDLFRVL